MKNTNLTFTYSDLDDAFLYGTQENGFGIYAENGKWWGNLSKRGGLTIGHGPFDTFKHAKDVLFAELMKEEK